MRSEPRLLIFIPTYERFDCVMAQLRHLAVEKDDLRCQVIVSDNCSRDRRYADLADSDSGRAVLYQRHPVNIGGNANIASAFLACAGFDYLWILGDDDVLTEGALQLVLETIASSNSAVDMIYFANSSTVSETRVVSEESLLHLVDDGLGLISRVVYRCEYFAPFARYAYDYVNSGFPHLAVLFAAVRDQSQFVCTTFPVPSAFSQVERSDPVEATTYLPSTYGFVHLADFISDPARRRKLLLRWVCSPSGRVAARESYRHRRRGAECAGYLMATSPPAAGLFIASVAAMGARRLVRACQPRS